jgi:hypothetical protein
MFLMSPLVTAQQPVPIRQDVTPVFSGPVVFKLKAIPNNEPFEVAAGYKKGETRFITHDWVGVPEINTNFMTDGMTAKANYAVKRYKDQNGTVVNDNATFGTCNTADIRMQTAALGGKRLMYPFAPS